MPRLYAVIRSCGPAWNDALSLEQQPGWHSHARFMNDFEAEGFVLLGGLLDGAREALLVIRAGDEAEIRSRLAADPWTIRDLLRIARIHPWTLRLGSLP